MFKKILFILFIVLISGLSGIFADRYLFPHLATSNLFSKYDFLKKSIENTTVINRTEQVYVKEDSSVATLMSPVVSSVVNIVSYANPALKNSSKNLPGPIIVAKNGTGIIVTSDGLIMTYASAIGSEQASGAMPLYKYKIITSNGNTYDADLAGIDSWSNLAILKINASNLPVVSFGNFSDYQAGEKVISISNNYQEYQNQFDAGLLNSFDTYFNISGKNLNVPEKLEGVFETDFDSTITSVGAPVVDYSGKIVGIIGSVQINGAEKYFVIPCDKVNAVLDKFIKKDINNNPTLGIYYLPVNPTLKLNYNLTVDHGALVYSSSGQDGLAVILNSPAAKAGIKIGDIITKINGEDITASNNLSVILYKYKIEDQISMTIIRNGQEMNLPVQL